MTNIEYLHSKIGNLSCAEENCFVNILLGRTSHFVNEGVWKEMIEETLAEIKELFK